MKITDGEKKEIIRNMLAGNLITKTYTVTDDVEITFRDVTGSEEDAVASWVRSIDGEASHENYGVVRMATVAYKGKTFDKVDTKNSLDVAEACESFIPNMSSVERDLVYDAYKKFTQYLNNVLEVLADSKN